MAVAIDHYTESGSLWLQIEFAEIVQHVDGYVCDFDNFGCTKSMRPRFGIDVASDRSYRRDVRERFDNVRIADVASVEYAIGSAKCFDGFSPQ